MNDNYLINSSVWIEYFSGSKKGEKVCTIIEKEKIATSVFAVAEVADKFEREKKSFDVHLTFIQSRAEIIPLTVNLALAAAKLKNNYRKTTNKFGLGDAIHLASAQDCKAILVTTDTDFAEIPNVLLLE